MSTALTHSTELSKPDDGGDGGVWGPLVNAILDAMDRLTSGQATIDVTSANVTLSDSQGQTHKMLVIGTPVADRTITFPARSRLYHVYNGTGRTLVCTVTGSSTSVQIPDAMWQVFATLASNPLGATDLIGAIGGPNTTGGAAGLVKHPGRSFFGPGMFFYDRIMGFCRRSAGVMGVALDVGTPADTIRFDYRQSAANPAIGFSSDFLNGFYPHNDGVGWTQAGTHRGVLGPGLQVGTPTGGDKGTGSVNVSGLLYRNNAELPYQRSFAISGYTPGSGFFSTSHGLGGAPLKGVAKLTCLSADGGYSPGLVVQDPSNINILWSTTAAGFVIAAAGIILGDTATGAPFTITPAKWSLQVSYYR